MSRKVYKILEYIYKYIGSIKIFKHVASGGGVSKRFLGLKILALFKSILLQ